MPMIWLVCRLCDLSAGFAEAAALAVGALVTLCALVPTPGNVDVPATLGLGCELEKKLELGDGKVSDGIVVGCGGVVVGIIGLPLAMTILVMSGVVAGAPIVAGSVIDATIEADDAGVSSVAVMTCTVLGTAPGMSLHML